MPQTEHDLIKGCIARDRAFQTELYDLYAAKMLGVCLRYARSREEAEEILHEGFLRVFKYIGNFKNAGSFEGWIRKIMLNCALLRYRNKVQMTPVIQLDDGFYAESGEADAVSGMSAKEVLGWVQA